MATESFAWTGSQSEQRNHRNGHEKKKGKHSLKGKGLESVFYYSHALLLFFGGARTALIREARLNVHDDVALRTLHAGPVRRGPRRRGANRKRPVAWQGDEEQGPVQGPRPPFRSWPGRVNQIEM